MRTIDLLVIHCSATGPSQDIGARDIDRWHRERGWDGIGYHYVIRRDGRWETGRPHERAGAHARGYNHSSLGICLAGGVNAAGQPDCNYTAPQWRVLANLVRQLRRQYAGCQVVGHRDLPGVGKACPVFDVLAWVDGL
jgi:N-acetylmuramoyl-L-alanine amidase